MPASQHHSFRAVVAALVVILAACSPLLPPQGVNHAPPDGLDGIARRFAVQPLDPASAVPLTRQALEEIEKTDLQRRFQGITYSLTQGNRLAPNWLIQTPDAWSMSASDVTFIAPDCPHCDADMGLPACRVPSDCDRTPCKPLRASVSRPTMRARTFCVGQSDVVLDRYYDLIVSAHQAVDVTILQPPADFRFRAALRNALSWLAASGRAVTVRIMIGNYPPNGTDAVAFLRDVVRDAGLVRRSRLTVYVGTTRSCNANKDCDTLSWNHAKIVAIDGARAIVGGHNMWTNDYLLGAPAHDLSMEVSGPAAAAAHQFADALWSFVCSRPVDDPLNLAFKANAGQPQIARGCLAKLNLPPARASAGGAAILAVGRLASGIHESFDDQSLIVRDLMIGAATRTIRMVQQDIGFSIAGSRPTWPDTVLARFADLIARQGDVYLVLSNLRAAGPTGSYSNDIPLDAVADRIRERVMDRTGLPLPEAAALVCRRLHLAPLRFGPDPIWPGDHPIGVHAKFWMVDDRVFYIGSENLYPVNLQEFGYIVEDRTASTQVLKDYWDHVWQWSRPAAISGEDAAHCRYNDSPPLSYAVSR